jgi:8-oxo-dGTP pyrophosphatase MutT (NUDIX family)
MKKGAGVLLVKDGKILLVKAGPESLQADGSVAFPGGHVEDGETEEATAKREFTEETGLVAGKLIDFPGNYVEATVERKDGMIEFSFKVFLALDCSGELKATEETEPFWVDALEARKMKLYGKNNQILDSALTYLKIL